MSAGFPETPKGSPGGIQAAAGLLRQAAGFLRSGSSTLSRTAGGLSGVSWSSPAEGRFTGAAAGPSGVCDGAVEALQICAQAADDYAEALETAKQMIDRAREEYEEANIAQASAGALIGRLYFDQAMADPKDAAGFDSAIAQAQDDMIAAGDRAQAALRRAQRARDDFDDAERRAIGQFDGTGPGAAPVFGAPAVPATDGTVFPGPGPLFTGRGTGGLGVGGGGFGVPAGGLGNHTGQVPFEALDGLDGYAYNRWLDLHGQTEVDDLTIAITGVASFGAGGAISGLLSRAATGAASRGASSGAANTLRGTAGRGTAGRGASSTADDAATAAANAGVRAHNIEKTGDLAGMAGMPYAGEAGKFAAWLSHQEVRFALKAQSLHVRHEMERAVKSELAALLAARSMQQGVRRGMPDDAVARLRELSGVP